MCENLVIWERYVGVLISGPLKCGRIVSSEFLFFGLTRNHRDLLEKVRWQFGYVCGSASSGG